MAEAAAIRPRGFTQVILVERRPQSLAYGDPCGALGIDPAVNPGSGAMMPLLTSR